MNPPELDYDSLVQDYESRLETNLRGFRGGADFLEAWAHEADPINSIVGIFEAAKTAGLPELALSIGMHTQGELNFGELAGALQHLGEVRTSPRETSTAVRVRFFR